MLTPYLARLATDLDDIASRPVRRAHLDRYRVQRDGAWYVLDDGTVVSPPMPTRAAAFDLAVLCEALPRAEQQALWAGRRHAPGCAWLIGAAS